MGNFKMGIEIPVFLIFFSLMLGGPVNTNFIIYRTCYILMGNNETDCAKLGINTTDNATKELEKEVEPLANYISLIIDLVSGIIPCITCIFVGPWSDKKGRRPVLIIAITGFVLSNVIKVIVAAIPELSPWYLFLQCVPTLLSGGLATFIMISFCYLIDVTPAEYRGFRMGILEGIFALGMLLGTVLSSYLFALIDYTGVFLVCSILAALALAITILFLDETVQITEDQDCKFFTLDNLKEASQTTFKKREGYNRFILLVSIAALIFYIMAEMNSGTEALLLRSKFHWELEKLTIYSAIRSIIAIVGGFFGIYILHMVLKVQELPLISIALIFCALNTFIVTFAEYDWQIYVAASLRIMAAVVTPMVRSLMSKIIPHDEVGKVFSFGISLETLVATVAGPIYMFIYTNSINVFPGAFDLIPFSLHILNLLFFICIIILKQRSNSIVYLNIQEDAESFSTFERTN